MAVRRKPSSAPPGDVRAVIYCRLSRNRTGERSASTERQETECRKLAEARGWQVVAVEVDDDVSAYSGKDRPGYLNITAALEAGTVDAVIAWAPDRLHRSPAELETFIDLVESVGAEVATVQAGRVDLASPAGRMQARQLGIIARYESEHRSERTRLAHDQIAAEGRWKGGRRPYGYENVTGTGTLRIVPTEAEVIREAAARVLAGERVGTVANDLERRGIPTVTGARWRSQTLRRVIASPTTAGRRVSAGEDVGPAQWEPILDVPTIEAVSAVLAGGHRRGRVPRVALLSGGRLVCGACSAPMSTARRENGRRLYRCLGCFAQVAAEPLENFVEGALIHVLSDAALPDAPTPTAAPTEALDAIEAELSDLAADMGAGRITRAEWLAARGPIMVRIDAAKARFAQSVGSSAVVDLTGPGVAAKAWPSLTLERRQAVVDALLEVVMVKRATRRGPGLDTNRVVLRWRA
jgi:DNA invertase Pin-like site-specific DNA recombinase